MKGSDYINEISISEVVSVDEAGIIFKNGGKIIFSECIKNFNVRYPQSNMKCVARRDITAKPPYFLFYTGEIEEQKIQLVFDMKGLFSKSKNEKAFLRLQLQIKNYGFTTYDLS